MFLSSHISDFLIYLREEKSASNRTIQNYNHYLSRFLEFAGDINPDQINPEMIQSYRVYLSQYLDPVSQTPLKHKTQDFFLIALRSFLRFLDEKNVQTLSAEEIMLLGQDAPDLQVLDTESLSKLLSSPDTSTKDGLRDKAILEMLFSTGLRVSELASLNKNQVDTLSREFEVSGKGGKRRVVYLSKEAASWVEKYIQSRHDDYKPLFIRYQGKIDPSNEGEAMRLTTRSIERTVEKYVKKEGLKIKATPHTLRHNFAKELLDKGADLESVQEVLGHQHAATIQMYKNIGFSSKTLHSEVTQDPKKEAADQT